MYICIQFFNLVFNYWRLPGCAPLSYIRSGQNIGIFNLILVTPTKFNQTGPDHVIRTPSTQYIKPEQVNDIFLTEWIFSSVENIEKV